jgi:hypothetical protein
MSFVYGINTGSSVISTSPYWILVVVPFYQRYTLSADRMAAFDADVSEPEIKGSPSISGPMLLLDNHCVRWSVSGSKTGHVHSASFTLVPPDVIDESGSSGIPTPEGYYGKSKTGTYNIAPQDWVMFWAMNDKTTYDKVRSNIVAGKAANDAYSGLKFVGKVDSFRTNVSVMENGQKINRYSMQCSGFKEFDNSIYYNPLAFSSDTAVKEINDLISGLNDFLVGDNKNLWISTQEAIFKLTGLFFDVDFQKQILEGNEIAASIASSLASFSSVNKPYLVPNKIAQLLGVDTQSKTVVSYGDILYRYVGIEEYVPYRGEGDIALSSTPTNVESKEYVSTVRATRPSSSFSGTPLDKYNSRSLKTSTKYPNCWQWTVPISSEMIKQTLSFDNRPIWSILTTYLNEPVDEMFTTLRLTPYRGQPTRIMPSLICRQLPFNSEPFANAALAKKKDGNLGITKFIDLPRWVIGDSYIQSYAIGLSDAGDINYVHLEPQLGDSGLSADLVRANNLVFSPPMVDHADISRNGLRTYQRTLSAYLLVGQSDESIETMRWWTGLMSDIMMRMRYMANGNVVCKGIQEPISVGDNTQIYNTLFHIESLSHEGGIDSSGKKSFNTSMGLSMGVKLNAQQQDFIPQELKTNRT